MALKNIAAAILCAALLTWGDLAMSDQYRPDEFLGLDLSRAVLSPKPLGPASEFAPVAVEVKAGQESKDAPPPMAQVTRAKTHMARMGAENRRGKLQTRLARHHGNPLDAQARDTRIQVWPCKSGGICDWQRQ